MPRRKPTNLELFHWWTKTSQICRLHKKGWSVDEIAEEMARRGELRTKAVHTHVVLTIERKCNK